MPDSRTRITSSNPSTLFKNFALSFALGMFMTAPFLKMPRALLCSLLSIQRTELLYQVCSSDCTYEIIHSMQEGDTGMPEGSLYHSHQFQFNTAC